MNKEINKKMKILMKKDKSLYSCAFYEMIGALVIGLSINKGEVSVAGVLLNLLALIKVNLNYFYATIEIEKDKYKEEHIEEYEDLKRLYNQYIDMMAYILKEYEYEDDLQLCVILDSLLYLGVFSYNGKYTYNNFNVNNEYYDDLLGSFVLTGYGVCRHSTNFMIDLLTKLDIKCFKISCKRKDSKNYHALVGLISNDEKYVYDFTNHFFGIINNQNIYPVGEDSIYRIINTSIDYKLLKNIPSKSIDIESVNKYTEALNNYCDNLVKKFAYISILFERQKGDIAHKTLKLMPRK